MNENPPTIDYFKGVVKEIKKSEYQGIENPNRPLPDDFIIEITNGTSEEFGKEVKVYSENLTYPIGTTVFLKKETYPNDSYYVLIEKVRSFEIFFSVIFFFIVVVVLYGKKGVKSLLSLILTLAIIFILLVPATLSGYNPVLVASLISIILLATIMLITNGRNVKTYIALAGCIISVFITTVLAYLISKYSLLTGQTDSAWSFLTYTAGKNINFSLLVIAGMIIGTIGAVDDAAITQVSVVSELKKLNPKLSSSEYYKKAMNVGKDHAGALINTLVLAYTASSLPLLLVLYTSPTPAYILLNQEYMVTEIFRSIISSIGLLLAIPITTYIAVMLINKLNMDNDHQGHSHAHHNH